jgi:hypothetical protein
MSAPLLRLPLLALLLCTAARFVSAQAAFSIVPSPNVAGSNNHRLYGVAALTQDDVWAVGFYTNNATGQFLNLAMHWNGADWTITPTPNPSQPNTDQLKKVAAVSSNDVWAIGGAVSSIILRWDGVQWTQVPRPPVVFQPPFNNVAHALDDIAAVASNDIWAVGWLDSQNGGSITLTMHWDGAQWTQIPSPNALTPSGSTYSQRLEAVAAIASNDVWAVGFYRVGNLEHPLTMHWDGSKWSLVPAPNGPPWAQAPNGDGWLHGIAAAGPNDVWAVGEYEKRDFTVDAKPLAMHWDGSNWTVMNPPNPAANGIAPIYSVTARDADDFIAVGWYQKENQGLAPFAVRWNGTDWLQMPAEDPAPSGTGWNQLRDIATDATGSPWTVGVLQATFSSGNFTLVERANMPNVQMRGIAIAADRSVVVQGSGVPNQQYAIKAADELTTRFETLGWVFSDGTGKVQWTEPGLTAAEQPRRFFKFMWP